MTLPKFEKKSVLGVKKNTVKSNVRTKKDVVGVNNIICGRKNGVVCLPSIIHHRFQRRYQNHYITPVFIKTPWAM